jgi:hypothetical protein
MDQQIPEDPYRILARERSHEDARQTVLTQELGQCRAQVIVALDKNNFNAIQKL